MIGFLVRLNEAKNLTNGHLTGAEEKKGRRGGNSLPMRRQIRTVAVAVAELDKQTDRQAAQSSQARPRQAD